jgi:site-specific recombinase XerD
MVLLLLSLWRYIREHWPASASQCSRPGVRPALASLVAKTNLQTSGDDGGGEMALASCDSCERDYDLSPEQAASSLCPQCNRPLRVLSNSEVTDLRLPCPRPADADPVAIYMAQLQPGSLSSTRAGLDVMAALLTEGRCDASTLDWSQLRAPHTQALHAQLVKRYSAATVIRMLSALRRTLKEAWRLGQMDTEVYQKAIDLPPVRRAEPADQSVVTTDRVAALFNVCQADASPYGKRDTAILAVFSRTGVRCGELVALDLSHFDPVRAVLVVAAGHRGKERKIHLPEDALQPLNAWIATRGSRPGPLFLPILTGNQMAEHRLSPVSVRDMLRKRAAAAGIDPITPHDLRSAFIRQLFDHGVDARMASELAGHLDIRNTRSYGPRVSPAETGTDARGASDPVFFICGRCEQWLPVIPKQAPRKVKLLSTAAGEEGSAANRMESQFLCDACWEVVSHSLR